MPTPTELKDQGLKYFRAEKLAEAAQAFAAAASAYQAQGDAAAAAEMRNNQCVALMGHQQWDAALQAVEGTPEIFRGLNDKMREAQAIANLAAAHDGAGHTEPAAEHYGQAIDLFHALGETENRAACFKKLGALQLKQGKQLQALAAMQSGLKLSTELTPEEKRLKFILDKAMNLMNLKR